MTNQTRFKQSRFSGHAGFSILEVMIGIFIFVVGLLALSALQGALTRSMADAKVRTTATNIAERILESQRGFSRLQSDTANPKTFFAFNDITSADTTETVDGVTYSIDMDVSDFYYQLAGDNFSETAVSGAISPTYKQVEITVSWDAAQSFRAEEGTDITAAGLGSGDITLTASIPALVTTASAFVADDPATGENPAPPVTYTPGLNPDIVSLSLGDNKFKESTLPVPKVIRVDELVETRFDVITYSSGGNGSLFLRREEFVAVSCECELKSAPGSAIGRRPTLWAGDEYSDAELVDKAYGVPANNIQSPYCDACCRDHHDGGTGSNDPAGDVGAIRFDPFRASTDYWGSGETFAGDHKHYKKDRFGNLSLAENVDDVYVESCRMVRKDGFFRTAQDFRREGINVFPYDFLDETAEVNKYSAYATGAVETYVGSTTDGYESAPPLLVTPTRTAVGVSPPPDSDLTLAYTYLPTALGADYQQLRSRGIYIDYLSEDLRAVISCLEDGGDAETCSSGDVVLDQTASENLLEMVPFFDVQLTYLNRWTESPPNIPVDTTNEALRSDNAHSRGVASKHATVGTSQVLASGNRGNSGITDTDPIDPNFLSMVSQNGMQVIINNDNPPPPNGTLVTAVFTSGVPGVQASSVEIEASGATCDRTVTGFICLVPNGQGATITLSNYHKNNNTNIVACSYEETLPGTSGSDQANRPFTVFDLDDALDTIIYQITIEAISCGG